MTEKNKVKVLVVDDHPESLVALEAVLASPNYQVVKAASGEEALKCLLRMDFALLLLDVQMPVLNGFELAGLIRQRERNRHVPIIFITGFKKDTESIAEGYLSGGVDYLLKPVDPDVLRAKVAFFIDLYVKNQSLRDAGTNYRQILETARVVVWRADAQTLQLNYVSREAEKILGYSRESWTSIENFWKDHIHPEDRNWVVSTLLKTAQQRSSSQIDYRMISEDGRTVWIQSMFQVPLNDPDCDELVGIMIDITERKSVEEATRKMNEELELRVQERTSELQRANELATQAERRYRDLLQGLDAIVWEAVPETWEFKFVSSKAEDILGYPVQNWLQQPEFWKEIVHPEDRLVVIPQMLKTVVPGHEREFEYRVLAADGRVVWLHNIIRLTLHTNTKEGHLRGIMIDITERKKTDELLQASLSEKEMLLKEIHHRVKNNLQIIFSLLNLQKRRVKNQDTRQILSESQNRVRSMALVHEKLYQTADLAEIDFAGYISDLAHFLLRSYGIESNRIKLNVHSDVRLNIDTAIPCGLIVNELLSNAFKYAFPEGRTGEILISLTKEEQKLQLLVKDNGVGFPDDVKLKDGETLGMRLVQTLTKQLEGNIEMNNDSGTELKISFSQTGPHGRTRRAGYATPFPSASLQARSE